MNRRTPKQKCLDPHTLEIQESMYRQTAFAAVFAVCRAGLVLPALALAIVSGCGGDDGPARVAVRGSVSLDNQPLAAGVIRFIPTGESSGPAAMAVIKDGVYELEPSEGPIVGTHRVEIEATDYLGFAIDDEAAFAQNVEQKKRPPPKNPLPEIYNRRSTLTAVIDSDEPHEFDFPLSSQGGQTARR
jgi:hypothetical protein